MGGRGSCRPWQQQWGNWNYFATNGTTNALFIYLFIFPNFPFSFQCLLCVRVPTYSDLSVSRPVSVSLYVSNGKRKRSSTHCFKYLPSECPYGMFLNKENKKNIASIYSLTFMQNGIVLGIFWKYCTACIIWQLSAIVIMFLSSSWVVMTDFFIVKVFPSVIITLPAHALNYMYVWNRKCKQLKNILHCKNKQLKLK